MNDVRTDAESITTCRCGHVLGEHDADGCRAEGCVCDRRTDTATEAEVEAVDEL